MIADVPADNLAIIVRQMGCRESMTLLNVSMFLDDYGIVLIQSPTPTDITLFNLYFKNPNQERLFRLKYSEYL